jgi:DNA-binding response OmpR family regulator
MIDNMKIIMMSSRNHESEVLKGMQSGADYYLAKPFSLVEFENMVKRLLNIELPIHFVL